MKPDNTKFEWEKHSHIEPLTDKEFDEVLAESKRMRGIADDAMHLRLIATIEALRGKLMKQSHALFELKQEQKRLKSIPNVKKYGNPSPSILPRDSKGRFLNIKY